MLNDVHQLQALASKESISTSTFRLSLSVQTWRHGDAVAVVDYEVLATAFRIGPDLGFSPSIDAIVNFQPVNLRTWLSRALRNSRHCCGPRIQRGVTWLFLLLHCVGGGEMPAHQNCRRYYNRWIFIRFLHATKPTLRFRCYRLHATPPQSQACSECLTLD